MQNLHDLLADAQRKEQEARSARDAAEAAIKAALDRLLPPGAVIDLRVRRGLPEYLMRVKTIGGKDHGTRIFRIEKIARILFDAMRPELAQWEANAIPISEKTGKDMDGRVSHALNNRGNVVRICGHISVEQGPDEHPDAQMARMLAMLENVDANQPQSEASSPWLDQSSIDDVSNTPCGCPYCNLVYI